jgi:DNA-binding transcriptional LysR family regulator
LSARVLGKSPASITRAVASIEDRLGTQIVRRTTRALKLTEAGERYIVVARRVLTDLDEAERSADAGLTEPQGLLSVTAPVAFGSLHVRPIVDTYLGSHPGVRVRLLLLDRVVSIIDEGVDVAVRIAHLADSALIAIAVGSVRRMVVASPEYLERHGRPKTPSDLAAHRCVASTAITPSDVWTFGARREGERAKHVRIAPVLSVNLAEASIRSALTGIGITCALSYQVSEQLKSGALVRLLGAFEPPPLPVHLVYPAANARTAKTRAFVELAAPRLRSSLS